MKKWLIRLSIIVIILAIGLISFKSALRLYRNEKVRLYEDEVALIPGIVCIGDSLTHGTGGEGISYPDYLGQMMELDGYVIPVYNLGVGGENSITITERMGGMPFRVNGLTIPEDTEPVAISFQPYGDYNIVPLRQGSPNNSGINPCIIAGVEGDISIIQEGYTSEEYSYEFVRSVPGDAVEVDSGEAIETYASSAYQGCIQIIFMGSNGGYASSEDLIAQYDSIINNGDSNGRFIIVGMTLGSRDEYDEIDGALLEAYGDRYINLRNIFCDAEEITRVGVVPSDADKEQMTAGIVPDCIRTDEIHYTEAGYRLLSQVVYDKIIELGYLNDIDEIADDYNSKWKLLRDLEVRLR